MNNNKEKLVNFYDINASCVHTKYYDLT
jgi:hypothetical protein